MLPVCRQEKEGNAKDEDQLEEYSIYIVFEAR